MDKIKIVRVALVLIMMVCSVGIVFSSNSDLNAKNQNTVIDNIPESEPDSYCSYSRNGSEKVNKNVSQREYGLQLKREAVRFCKKKGGVDWDNSLIETTDFRAASGVGLSHIATLNYTVEIECYCD